MYVIVCAGFAVCDVTRHTNALPRLQRSHAIGENCTSGKNQNALIENVLNQIKGFFKERLPLGLLFVSGLLPFIRFLRRLLRFSERRLSPLDKLTFACAIQPQHFQIMERCSTRATGQLVTVLALQGQRSAAAAIATCDDFVRNSQISTSSLALRCI